MEGDGDGDDDGKEGGEMRRKKRGEQFQTERDSRVEAPSLTTLACSNDLYLSTRNTINRIISKNRDRLLSTDERNNFCVVTQGQFIHNQLILILSKEHNTQIHASSTRLTHT
jgi:hypothetical protein